MKLLKANLKLFAASSSISAASAKKKYKDALGSVANNIAANLGTRVGGTPVRDTSANDAYKAQMAAKVAGTPGTTTNGVYTPLNTSGIDYDKQNMSAADYAKAQEYKGYWKQANEAGDKQGMDYWHNMVEGLRNNYYYTGGSDGSQIIGLQRPQEQLDIDAILAQIDSRIGSSPTYTSRWDPTAQKLAQAYLDMSYDNFLDSDQYKALANRYGLQGKNNMQNVLGQIASRTGGLASSYSTSAANQSYNDYMSQLSAAAYDMYANENTQAYNKAKAAFEYDDNDYQRYLDDLAQFNNNRSYAYGVLSDALKRSDSNKEWDYKVAQNEKAEAQDYITMMLNSGMTPEKLSSSMVDQSGWSADDIATLYNNYVMKNTPKGGGGNPKPAAQEVMPETWAELYQLTGLTSKDVGPITNKYSGLSSAEQIANTYSDWKNSNDRKQAIAAQAEKNNPTPASATIDNNVYKAASDVLDSRGEESAFQYLQGLGLSDAELKLYINALGL